MHILLAKDFGLLPGDDRTLTQRLNEALNTLRDREQVTLVFEPGTYHFYPDNAPSEMMYIANHHLDEVKSIAFNLTGFRGLTLDGQGAEFIFHSEILPFYCKETVGLTLKNFFMDYTRPILSQGEILESGAGRLVMKIDPELFPYVVENNQLYFTDEAYRFPIDRMLAFDPGLRQVARGAVDYELGDVINPYVFNGSRARLIRENVVELTAEDHGAWAKEQPGNVMVLWHHLRTHAGVYVLDSADFIIEDVTFYHTAGIAVHAERTENLTLNRVKVITRPGGGRVFSAMADATHFVACYGTVRIMDCVFENQLDDAINIHGIFGTVDSVEDEHTLLMRLHHDMQLGTKIGRVGDRVALLERDTMLPHWEGTLAALEMLSPEIFRLRFEEILPGDAALNSAVEDITAKPHADISRCVFRGNRARGILLTCKSALVSDCLFESAGAAVLLEGDASSWFESGAVTKIHLKNNVFKHCGYIPQWGKGILQSSPSVKKNNGRDFFHGELLVENCEFITEEGEKRNILSAHSIRSVRFKNCVPKEYLARKELYQTRDIGELVIE